MEKPSFSPPLNGIHHPLLEGRKLTLRPLRMSDSHALHSLASDQAVSRFLHEGPVPSIKAIGERIAATQAQWGTRGYGMMAVEDKGGFVGRLGVYHPPDTTQPLLVYVFQKQSWGRGYATEGVSLLLTWLSRHDEPRSLIAYIDPLNHASRRVIEKFGAFKESTVQRGISTLDVWRVPLQSQASAVR